MLNHPKSYTIYQAADRMGRTTRCVKGLVKAGILPYITTKSSASIDWDDITIRESDIARWEAQNLKNYHGQQIIDDADDHIAVLRPYEKPEIRPAY
ncbi:MAG: hypothetical protein VKL39_24550 [Leptolyngbyaceae bacterium]|nr:hypothetical protein [Leptolyngbyaceae bacterium]